MFKVHRRAPLGSAAALGLVVFGLMAYTPVSAMADTCANEPVRAEQDSSFLPECRAYELVSPPGATTYLTPSETLDGARAAERLSSSDGGITWFSYYPPPGFSGSSMHLLSTRNESGWSTEDVVPPQSTSTGAFIECGGYPYFSADLTKEILADGQQGCPRNDPPLTESEPEGFENLFLHNLSAESYSLVNVTPPSEAPAEARLQGMSSDFTHVVFSENAKLTPSAPTGEALYEWVDGRVHLVSILPDGTAVPGRLVDGASESGGTPFTGTGYFLHAVSANGSRVVFEWGGKLYDRKNAEMEQSQLGSKGECLESGMACTVQIDASATGGINGSGRFIAATAQGTDIFFTDGGAIKLTSDTVPNSGQNLYEFDVETGELTDLTPFASAQVLGLAGSGEEGNDWHLYAVAEGSFGEANPEGHEAQPNVPNLYELSPGKPPEFIATLAASDSRDWEGEEVRGASASPNGRYLTFGSVAELTEYDNADAVTSGPDSELFLYDSTARRLTCVSCGPGNALPVGASGISPVERASANGFGPGYFRRYVFNDGRVVFDTPNALVARDVDGQTDVYMYSSGQAHLISSGTSTAGSIFYEASGPNQQTGQEGEDVFFATIQHLLGTDTGNGPALYDARVAGGFPGGAGEAVEGQSCESADACKPPPGEPPAEPFAASDALVAGGNLLTPPEPVAPPVDKSGVKNLTRAQKLTRALKTCREIRNKKKRAVCEKQARRKYGRSK